MISKILVKTGVTMRETAIASAREELANDEKVYFGTHIRREGQIEVIRYNILRKGELKRLEVSLSSKLGKELFPIAKRNAILRKMLKELLNEQKEVMTMLRSPEAFDAQQTKIQNQFAKPSQYSYEAFLKLQELNDTAVTNGYKYGRYTFRSKSEMVIAQILDQLGLEYKYEPIITINGHTKYPDFAVYCPEIGRFFFIEHLGMMDQMKYKMENLEKMQLYENAKIRNGVDIIYTTEFGKGTLDSKSILGKIMGLAIAHTIPSLTIN